MADLQRAVSFRGGMRAGAPPGANNGNNLPSRAPPTSAVGGALPPPVMTSALPPALSPISAMLGAAPLPGIGGAFPPPLAASSGGDGSDDRAKVCAVCW